jgi:hypothetical protein
MCDRKLKCIRTDNAGELSGGELKQYLDEIGVFTEETLPYEHEQNGAAERANRTLEDKARCMLFDAGLPVKYWADAIRTAAYVASRSPVKGEKLTPVELFSGIKPDLSNIRIFGSVCYARKPVKDVIGSNKFEPRGERCRMIGYAQGGHSYVLIREHDQREIIRTHVIFHERELTPKNAGATMKRIWSSEAQNEQKSTGSNSLFPYNVESSPEEEESDMREDGEVVDDAGSGGDEFEPGENDPDTSEAGDDSEDAGSTSTEERPPSPPPVLRRSSRTPQPRKNYWETGVQKSTAPGPSREARTIGLRPRTQQGEKSRNAPPNANLTPAEPENDDPLVGFAFLTADEAMSGADREHWQDAMEREIKTLQEFGTWELVELPPGRKMIGCKWHLTRKVNADGSQGEYKARLVAKGYSQIEGVDYFETFAPVARIQSIRILLALSNDLDLEVDQIDIKAAYLNGWMDEEIYMTQPPGYVDRKARQKACRLIRGLYGTKQAGNIWNKSLNTTMVKNGYQRLISDQCVYIRGTTKELATLVIVVVYVDDILVIGHENAKQMRRTIIEALKSEYNVKEMGPVSRYLGVLVSRDRAEGLMVVSQRDFAIQVLERFGMMECRQTETPMEIKADIEPRREDEDRTNQPYRSLVGSLMYLTMCTRPDLAHAVGVLSRFLEDPAERHWSMGLRVLKYLKGTVDLGLEFRKGSEGSIVGYSDSDWVSDQATGRSTRGFVLIVDGNVVNWKSKRHRTVATSTTTAETDALYHGVLDHTWTRNLLQELGQDRGRAVWYCDNQAAVAIVNSSKNVDKVRHELVKVQYLREKVEKMISVEYISTDKMIADVLTKQLPRQKFLESRVQLGLVVCSRSEKWGSVGNCFSDRNKDL